MKIENKLNKKEKWGKEFPTECKNCKYECEATEQDQFNCCLLDNHPYSERMCECGKIYCWDCATSTGDDPYGCGVWTACPECGCIVSDK